MNEYYLLSSYWQQCPQGIFCEVKERRAVQLWDNDCQPRCLCSSDSWRGQCLSQQCMNPRLVFHTDYKCRVARAGWNANGTAEWPSSGTFTLPRALLEAKRVLRLKGKGGSSKNGDKNTPAPKVTSVLWEQIGYRYFRNGLGCDWQGMSNFL